MDNHSAFGRSRVALKSFETLAEAKNFLKYCNSDVIKYTFLLTDEALSSLAKWVPDILNYSDQNNFINFKKDVNEQLSKLIGIDREEFEYIKHRVQVVRGGKKSVK